MSGKLKLNQICPLHRSRTCPCHPEPVVKFQRAPKIPPINGVRTFPDGREVCSPAVRNKRKNLMIQQGLPCMACHQPFVNYNDAELGHIESCGLNGSKRNDSRKNTGLIHAWTNRDQGSMSLEDYLAKLAESGRKPCEQS